MLPVPVIVDTMTSRSLLLVWILALPMNPVSNDGGEKDRESLDWASCTAPAKLQTLVHTRHATPKRCSINTTLQAIKAGQGFMHTRNLYHQELSSTQKGRPSGVTLELLQARHPPGHIFLKAPLDSLRTKAKSSVRQVLQ